MSGSWQVSTSAHRHESVASVQESDAAGRRALLQERQAQHGADAGEHPLMHGLRKAMKRYGVHMAAIVILVIVSLGIAGYLLSNQRFYLPAWVPVIGTDFYVVEAEFSNAQAVTPGQGQTVNIAGVPVG